MPLPTTINSELLGMAGLVPARLTRERLQALSLWNTTREDLAGLLQGITSRRDAEDQGLSAEEWTDLQTFLENWNTQIELETGSRPPVAPVTPPPITPPTGSGASPAGITPRAGSRVPQAEWNDALAQLGQDIRVGIVTRQDLPQITRRLAALYPVHLQANQTLEAYLADFFNIYSGSWEREPGPVVEPPPPGGTGGTMPPGTIPPPVPPPVPPPPPDDLSDPEIESRELAQHRFQRALLQRLGRHEISPFDYRSALQNFSPQYDIFSTLAPLRGQTSFQDYLAGGGASSEQLRGGLEELLRLATGPSPDVEAGGFDQNRRLLYEQLTSGLGGQTGSEFQLGAARSLIRPQVHPFLRQFLGEALQNMFLRGGYGEPTPASVGQEGPELAPFLEYLRRRGMF